MAGEGLSPEDIEEQRRLLETYRRTLQIYLQQQAEIGKAYSPPALINGIFDTRANIQRIKQILRAAQVTVADDPNDEDIGFLRSRSVRSSGFGTSGVIAVVALVVAVGAIVLPQIMRSPQSNAPTLQQASVVVVVPTDPPATSVPDAVVQATTEPQSTAFPTLTTVLIADPAPTADTMALFGPRSGSLYHNITNDNMELSSASVTVQDFSASVRFFNPYDRAEKPWNYGFLFRMLPDGNQYRVYLDSDGKWFLQLATVQRGVSRITIVQSGVVAGMDRSEAGSNSMQIIVRGQEGQLIVNQQLTATLDLSSNTESGDVAIGLGFAVNDEMLDHVTRYQDFSIQKLQ